MSKKVDLKTIYPNEIKSNYFNPSLGICGVTLKVLLESNQQLPKIKTNIFQNRKVGVLIIGGNIKELDFNNTNLDIRANKCDCLAVWFNNDLSFPTANYDDKEVSFLRDNLSQVEGYFDLPLMIHLLIGGIEQTLLRRVVAIGQFIEHFSELKWIEIPKNRIKAPESKEIVTNEDLP